MALRRSAAQKKRLEAGPPGRGPHPRGSALNDDERIANRSVDVALAILNRG